MSDEHCENCNNGKNEEMHHHDHEEANKIDIILYIISLILFVLTFIPALQNYKLFAYLLVLILSGSKLIFRGIKNILLFNFEEDTLMTIAMVAAFILGEFPESCMIILLYSLGEFLEDKAVENSNKNIKDIVEIKAKTANVIVENDGKEIEKTINVEEIQIGQKILIKPGKMVPLDCKIIKGKSTLNTSNITGESMPKEAEEGQSILSGSINLTGSLTCIVEKDYKNSTASQIVDLVHEATNNKGKTEDFINKFSKIYTPFVIILSLFIAIIPSAISGDFKAWIMRGLVFLVASCPCSIVISIPLAFFTCIGAISKKGMVIKGTKHIENLAKAKYIGFDKTGTITTGKMQVEKIVSRGNYTEDELLKYVYALERNSLHPISTAIKEKVEKDNIEAQYTADNFEEMTGYGIKATVDGNEILFGSIRLLDDLEHDMSIEKSASFIIIDDKLEGYVTFKEEIRDGIKNTIQRLKHLNMKEIIMLTGDNEENAKEIADKIGVDKLYADLLPQEKLEKVKEKKEDGKVIFIGDGINDSPVLAEADFGISMGEGTEIANNTADGILISNNITTIPQCIKITRKTMKIVKENIVFSLIAKVIVLTLGILGIAPIWLAVAADTGMSLLTVINSLRILK